MIRKMQCVGAVALMMVAVSTGWAQRPPSGFFLKMDGPPSIMLLGQKSVQEDLKLDEEQLKKVTETHQQQREAFEKLRDLSREEREKKMPELMKECEKLIAQILTAEQSGRLRQIRWQLQGAWAFVRPEVAAELKLGDEQQQKIKAIQEEVAREIAKRFDQEEKPTREEARKVIHELRRQGETRILEVTTAEQKARWKELTGEPFNGEIQYGPPR